MINSTSCAVSRTTQVEGEMEKMGEVLNGLQERLVTLGNRLDKVMCDPSPEKGEDVPIPALVPLATAIRSHRFAIERASAMVQDWLNRLEL